MSNIFELWRHNGELLPFGARRASWAETTHVVVEEIEIRRWPYGDAFGWVYVRGEKQPRLDAKVPFSARGVPDISCAGSYQWSFVALPGCRIGNPVLPKRSKPKRVHVLSTGDVLRFGKHRSDTIDQVFPNDPAWIKWALQNVETFAVDPLMLEKLTPADPILRIGNALQALNVERVESASSTAT